MTIYTVEYTTSYDYNEIIGYFLSKEEAEKKAAESEKQNPGFGFFVGEIEAE